MPHTDSTALGRLEPLAESTVLGGLVPLIEHAALGGLPLTSTALHDFDTHEPLGRIDVLFDIPVRIVARVSASVATTEGCTGRWSILPAVDTECNRWWLCHCFTCQAPKTPWLTVRWPIISMPLPEGPGVTVSVDYFGPFRSHHETTPSCCCSRIASVVGPTCSPLLPLSSPRRVQLTSC